MIDWISGEPNTPPKRRAWTKKNYENCVTNVINIKKKKFVVHLYLHCVHRRARDTLHVHIDHIYYLVRSFSVSLCTVGLSYIFRLLCFTSLFFPPNAIIITILHTKKKLIRKLTFSTLFSPFPILVITRKCR